MIDHFYTAGAPELQNAVDRFGYTAEGTAGLIYKTPQPDTIPLYRLYSPVDNDHLYTTSASEREKSLKYYTDEGISGYVYPKSCCGIVPLYRLYNLSGKDHLYTTSIDEVGTASRDGWVLEGITGYIFPST